MDKNIYFKMKLYFLRCLSFLFFTSSMCYGQYYSQYQQDQYVYETFFQGFRNGIFVDIGAHDGITLSNSCFFEKDLEWTGICVEPIPDVFSLLKQNRRCISVCGCITSKREKVAPFLRISGYSEMLSGLVDSYDDQHVKRILKELSIYGGDYEMIDVPCYRFNELLIANNLSHVHFLSIDTEGGELEILKSIDFSSIQIDVIAVENNYGDCKFEVFMNSKGYELNKNLGCDQIFVRSDFQPNSS